MTAALTQDYISHSGKTKQTRLLSLQSDCQSLFLLKNGSQTGGGEVRQWAHMTSGKNSTHNTLLPGMIGQQKENALVTQNWLCINPR